MAGDWIKFEKSTLNKPEVFDMAEELGIDPDAVIGKLLRVWDWFDDQSRDGNAPVTVRALLDRYAGVTGFVKAMENVGWMESCEKHLTIPNFDRHNGSPSKSRAMTKKRVDKHRSRNADSVTETVTTPLPEKRREEKSSTPLTPQGGIWDGVFPARSTSKSKADQRKMKVLRTNDRMIFIGKWFGRREDTLWTVYEAKALKDLNPSKDEVIEMGEFRSSDYEYHRDSLAALLNNWSADLDKARTMKSGRKGKSQSEQRRERAQERSAV